MASRLKEGTVSMHSTLKSQAKDLDEMEDITEKNLADVEIATDKVGEHVSKGWGRTATKWVVFFSVLGTFSFAFMTIRVAPRRKEACLFYCDSGVRYHRERKKLGWRHPSAKASARFGALRDRLFPDSRDAAGPREPAGHGGKLPEKEGPDEGGGAMMDSPPPHMSDSISQRRRRREEELAERMGAMHEAHDLEKQETEAARADERHRRRREENDRERGPGRPEPADGGSTPSVCDLPYALAPATDRAASPEGADGDDLGGEGPIVEGGVPAECAASSAEEDAPHREKERVARARREAEDEAARRRADEEEAEKRRKEAEIDRAEKEEDTRREIETKKIAEERARIEETERKAAEEEARREEVAESISDLEKERDQTERKVALEKARKEAEAKRNLSTAREEKRKEEEMIAEKRARMEASRGRRGSGKTKERGRDRQSREGRGNEERN